MLEHNQSSETFPVSLRAMASTKVIQAVRESQMIVWDEAGVRLTESAAGVGEEAVIIRLLWMDRVTFNYMLDNFTPVARNLVKILSARGRLSDQLIQALATLDVNGRVARQLLAFAEKYGFEKDGATQIRIVLTQGDIADLVGASRKRVNQTMVFFKEQALIDTDAEGKIAIRDSEGLAKFCR